MKRPAVALAIGLAAWLPAALAGVADVAQGGRGLGPADVLLTLGLWLAMALPLALLACVAARLVQPLGLTRKALGGWIGAGWLLAGWLGQRAGLLEGTPALLLMFAGLVAAATRIGSWAGLERAMAIALAASFPLAVLLAPGRTTPAEPGELFEATAPGVAAGTATAGSARHVVLIVLDTLRADHLGAYGNPDGHSPHFDRLARESALFERCYAPAAWTVPSHASLFTGLHPLSHGAHFDEHRWLDDAFDTIAEGLGRGGYRTLALSANHYIELAHLDQGFAVSRSLGEGFRGLRLRRPLGLLGGPARWIDEGAAQAPEELQEILGPVDQPPVPTFLFLNLLEPHWRYFPPARERGETLPEGLSGLRAALLSSRFYGPLAMAGAPLAPRTPQAIRALYAAEVRYQDRQLPRILEVLDQHLGRGDTLLIITSDHGENLGEGGRWDHVFAVNDHLIHVPMLVRAPGRLEPGARERGLCQLVDVPATIADWTGRELGVGVGQSLLEQPYPGRAVVVAQGDPFYGHLERMSLQTGPARDIARFTARLLAVSDGRFKLVRSSRDGEVLYDLASDPDELLDVRSEHPERARALEAALTAWRAAQPPYRRPSSSEGGGGKKMSEAERDRLRALGYLDN